MFQRSLCVGQFPSRLRLPPRNCGWLVFLTFFAVFATGCFDLGEAPPLPQPDGDQQTQQPDSGDIGQDVSEVPDVPDVPDEAEPEELLIQMNDSRFIPSTATVKAGTIVTFKNLEEAPHTVKDGLPGSADFQWESPMLKMGETWSRTFTEVGTHQFHCTVHEDVMQAEITVE